IELQEQKIEALKLYKKGLFQQVFKNDKEYKTYLLGDICDINTGKLDANAMVPDGKYRFYTCAKNYYHIDTYSFDTEALLISGNGAYVGYIHYYKGKFDAYQRTYILDNFKEDIQYIKCFLERYLNKRIQLEKKEGNTPYIVLSTLSDMTVKIPDINEQRIIVNVINNFNDKFNQEEEKFKLLIQLKKGLMQNMFV
ncbi:MAG: restriction endonuclease subunit S, partial [Clostridia bacterium]|nr:restriction endonuclease subunit S [Clostridia bacterium]